MSDLEEFVLLNDNGSVRYILCVDNIGNDYVRYHIDEGSCGSLMCPRKDWERYLKDGRIKKGSQK